MKLTIGWYIGYDEWANKNLASAIISELPEFNHKFNEKGDINIIFDPRQFRYFDPNFKNKII